MPIEVTITKSPENVDLSKTSQSFSESGGTIGRGPDNTWVLDDPEKYMSTRHTQLGVENGQYVLTDLSTNGTFVNGAAEPLGNGNKVVLNEGDRFAISDYEFIVNIRGQVDDSMFGDPMGSGPFPGVPADVPISDAPIPENNVGGGFAASPFSDDDLFGPSGNQMPLADHSPMSQDPLANSNALPDLGSKEMDPLAAFDKLDGRNSAGAGGFSSGNQSGHYPLPGDMSFLDNANSPKPPPVNPPFTQGTVGDNASSMNESIAWPKSNLDNSGGIPDDWNLDDPEPTNEPVNLGQVNIQPTPPPPPPPVPQANSFSNVEALSRLENEYLVLENENKELMTEIARLRHYIDNNKPSAQPVAEPSSRAYSMEDKTLIEAMGLSGWNLDQAKSKEISATVGILIRESLEGMMRVLSFRKKIKEEFRINVTTIQPIENNPLKFSANIDDAMENMFIKDNKAYKEPVEAVREGFQGIAEHQVAVLAGMQAAFRGMLERFDPVTLEKRFEKYNKSGLMQFGLKGKNWESYKNYHHGLSNDVENSFQHLFGYDFVQAYEDQLQRLLIARKASKKTNIN